MEVEQRKVISRFKSSQGEVTDLFDLPYDCNVKQLALICNAVLKKEDETPYLFFVNDKEITESLKDTLGDEDFNTEGVLEIIYQEQAVFKVRAVTRCTSSLPGHSKEVLCVAFSPNGQMLASGSADASVRFWDIHTQTPEFVGKMHTSAVLCIAWAPDAKKLASSCMQGKVAIWNPKTGQCNRTLSGHTGWVTALAWEPYHVNPECRKLVSSSKDKTIRVWDTVLGTTLFTLSSHTKGIRCVKWGGRGLIYSGSEDCTVKVWRASDGALCRTLKGHGHWVNSLAVSSEYVIKNGPFHPGAARDVESLSADELQKDTLKRYTATLLDDQERLVSGSDDFTLFLWLPEKQSNFVTRMSGHQQPINDVKFSPDGRLFASASFDHSVKIWNALNGTFVATFRGHVERVHLVSWACDSRLLVSGSADSTLKVWNMRTKKLEMDLPGHADSVYAVDWSPSGLMVASGGKDKVLKLWQN